MKSVKCQSCGFISADSAACKKCGTPITVIKHKFQPISTTSPGSMIWRDKDKLVMDLKATLPDRCVVCNGSADGKRFPLTLSYNHKLAKLPLAVGVASVSYKEIELPVGLCATHLSGQQNNVIFGIALIIIGLIVTFIGIFNVASANNVFIPLGALMVGIVISGVGAVLFSQTPLAIEDARETRFWIKGVSVDYLANLPPWVSRVS